MRLGSVRREAGRVTADAPRVVVVLRAGVAPRLGMLGERRWVSSSPRPRYRPPVGGAAVTRERMESKIRCLEAVVAVLKTYGGRVEYLDGRWLPRLPDDPMAADAARRLEALERRLALLDEPALVVR